MPRVARVRSRKKKVKRRKGPKATVDEDGIDATNLHLRPSERMKIRLASNVPEDFLSRPPIPKDPVTLYRVYKNTVQRVSNSINSLYSYAAYVLVCGADEVVALWLGEEAETEDIETAKELGLEVLRRDFEFYDAIETDLMVTMETFEIPHHLEYFLSKCWADTFQYNSKQGRADRRKEPTNGGVTVGYLEKNYDGSVNVREVGYSIPLESGPQKGKTPRITFPNIDFRTMIVISVNDFYYLWVTRDIPDTEVERCKRALIDTLCNTKNYDRITFPPTLRVIVQGTERSTFRRYFKHLTDFEPPDRTAPYIPADEEKRLRRAQSRGIFGDVGKSLVNAPASLGNFLSSTVNVATFGAVDFGTTEANNNKGARKRQSAATTTAAASAAAAAASAGEFGPKLAGGVRFADTPDGQTDRELAQALEQEDKLINSKSKMEKMDKGYGGGGMVDSDVAPMSSFFGDDEGVQSVSGDGGLGAGNGVSNRGRTMLTPDMLDVIDDHFVLPPDERTQLLKTAAGNPRCLLGWLIEIDNGYYKGLHVITGMQKGCLRKTYYRISSFAMDDTYVRIRREKKSGVVARPMRKVLEDASFL